LKARVKKAEGGNFLPVNYSNHGKHGGIEGMSKPIIQSLITLVFLFLAACNPAERRSIEEDSVLPIETLNEIGPATEPPPVDAVSGIVMENRSKTQLSGFKARRCLQQPIPKGNLCSTGSKKRLLSD
jgi:hypothetical protein